MSDETSLVSGRFTKLENGSPGIGLGSRSRLETSGDSDDRIGWHICLVLADRLSQRGGLSSSGARWTAREEVSAADRKTRTRQYWSDDRPHTSPHTVTAYENRIDGHDRIPGAMVDRTTTYVNAPPSAATRDRVARPVRTSTAAVPAPAPGSSRFSGPSRAGRVRTGYCRAEPRGVTGAIHRRQRLRLGSRNLFL